MKNSKQSLTISSVGVLIAIWIAQQAGIGVGEGEIITTIATIGKFAAVAGVYWGRIRQGDVSWLGRKS